MKNLTIFDASSSIAASARWWLILPLLLSLLALHPLVGALMQWMDAKANDLFFVLPLPESWCGGKVEHPVAVVAKDAAFEQLAQTKPFRIAIAQALNLLASAGVKTAALDFLFDEGREEETDRAFIEALKAFPTAILAHRFLPRRVVGTVDQISLPELQLEMPPPPLPLYGPIALATPHRGLVNIVPDYDGVVRFLPLAFRVNGQDDFLPSLGTAAWLEGQLADACSDLECANLPPVPPAGADLDDRARNWLESALAAAPRPFRKTGHSGLDAMLRRSEYLWLARWAARRSNLSPGEHGWQTWEEVGRTFIPATGITNTTKTWLNLPEGGIPWMGTWSAPCLRVRFTRTDVPKGDGILVDSLGFLVESSVMGAHNRLSVTSLSSSKEISKPIDLDFDLQAPGSFTLIGRAIDQADRPLSGIEVMAWPRSGGGYWASATTNTDGVFQLSNLPSGTYTLQAVWTHTLQVQLLHESSHTQTLDIKKPISTQNKEKSFDFEAYNQCRQVLTLQEVVIPADKIANATSPADIGLNADLRQFVVEIPPARFLTPGASLEVKVSAASVPQVLTVRGNPLWIERTRPEGKVSVATLSSGFEVTWLENYSPLVFASSGQLLGPDGPIPPRQPIAFTESNTPWQADLTVSTVVPPGTSRVCFRALPPVHDAQVELFREDLTDHSPLQRHSAPVLVDLWMGETSTVGKDVVARYAELSPVEIRFRLPNAHLGHLLVFRDSIGRQLTIEDIEKPVSLLPGNWRVFICERNMIHESACARSELEGTSAAEIIATSTTETASKRMEAEKETEAKTSNEVKTTVREIAPKAGRRGVYNRLAARYRGKTVFFGTHLAEDHDFKITPVNFLDRDFKHIAGVNLHAHLCSCLMRSDFLRPLPLHPDYAPRSWPIWTLLALLPFIFGIDAIVARRGAIAGGLATALFMTLWSGISLALFLRGWLLPVALPLLALGSFGVGRGFHAYSEVRRRERLIRSSFGRFVSKKMVEEIVRNPDVVKPGGEKKELTVMFTDLAGFTTISEMLSPEQLAALMNEYLAEMTNIVFQYDGTLDKYIGDAIMAFWNHPTTQPDHAIRAARCALAMQKRLAELRMIWKKRGLPEVSMRAGINTADCMVGFYGSSIQMNFTCLGDGVNLASRLEGANKAYGTLMMVAETTNQRLVGSGIRTRFLDFLAVKGKNLPIKTFELIGCEGENDELWEKVLPLYNRGIEAYLARRWDEAETAMNEVLKHLPSDGPAKTYLERIAAFKVTPPPPDWDGSFHLKTK